MPCHYPCSSSFHPVQMGQTCKTGTPFAQECSRCWTLAPPRFPFQERERGAYIVLRRSATRHSSRRALLFPTGIDEGCIVAADVSRERGLLGLDIGRSDASPPTLAPCRRGEGCNALVRVDNSDMSPSLSESRALQALLRSSQGSDCWVTAREQHFDMHVPLKKRPGQGWRGC